MRTVAIRDAQRDYLAVCRILDHGECFDQHTKEVKLRKYELWAQYNELLHRQEEQ